MKYRIIIAVLLTVAGFNTLPGQKPGKSYTVTGRVTDASEAPVTGAVILINNKATEIKTDEKGSYRIKVRTSDTLISVFYLKAGMSEEKLDGRSIINFRLSGNAAGLQTEKTSESDDQEINIGYGTVKKKDITQSVGKIDGTNNKYASYSNIYDMIKGEIPGVQVTGKKITIQGPTSINASTDPLIIVNGIEMSNIDDISPQLVKSIEVLKGSSASIYGSRGANGVLLITLKGSGR